ncbi:hypothetical protein Tco_0973146 [Tanacetum coccineum]
MTSSTLTLSYSSLVTGGHTSDRAEGALDLKELFVLCTNLSNSVLALEYIKDAQAAKISALKSRIKKFGKKEYVSKQGRKKSKPESTLDDNTVFEDQYADHGMEYIETEEAVDEGRQKGGNAKELVSTARPEVNTARPEVSTARLDIDAARQEDSAVEPRTPSTITSIFDDEDITMAQTLIKMKKEKAKEKGVSIKDVDDSSRHERSIITLKPLPTIDPKDKGKGVLKESPVKKVNRSNLDVAQIAKDAKIERLIHEKELAEMEREREERQRQDQASKLLAKERVAAVRNKPLTRTQLRSLMMTYLKHTGKYRHNQLNKKTFEEIQALYIKEQERDVDFLPIRSEKDENMIDKINKKAAGMDEEEVSESTKVEVKKEGHEENIRKRSGRRLKMKATKKYKRQKTDFDLEEEEQLRAYIKIVPDEEEEIDYEVLGMRLDFIELHSLVMQRFSTTTPEGIDLILWGDLRILFEETADDDIWKNQEKWIIKSWTFYENYGVHILALEDSTKIHMLAERRYPLIRETLERMMELRLTAESEGEAVFDLLRFIQKLIDEFEEQDGSEKDL